MPKKEISKPLVIVLCTVIIFSIAFSVRQYNRIIKSNLIAVYKEAITQKIAEYHGKLTGKNIDLVSSWMTFDYVNRIFELPADYLKGALAISDIRYPRIPISVYAKNHQLNSDQFLAEVQKAVADYFKAH